MALAIVLGVVFGGLIHGGLRWRATRREKPEVQSREQLAALVLYEEMKAAIDALDLALSGDGYKWFASMSESRTLSEAWHEHGEELAGLGSERWAVLSEAVTAVAPSYGLVSVSAQTDDLSRSLTERRELLVEGAAILRVARDQPPRKWFLRAGHID